MAEINIPRDEQEALRSIDVRALDKAIDACLDARRISSTLREYRLGSCGLFVAAKLREFETALAEYAGAKAPKKVAATESRARRAGSVLENAVQQMQHRIDTQEQEGQLFFVDDHIIPPSHFSQQLTVLVRYRWRHTIEAEWTHGSITFSHVHAPRPDYTVAPPKRKPSKSQQERDQQEELWRQWAHLMRQGLFSLVEYFREGLDGGAIPKTFQARADDYSRRLNNFSCRFWLEPAKTKSSTKTE
ncbi:hypothetical protein [Lysobacter antibioticus]|uniref:hypothetical protein n=1 Tax=Lysobacter antibioticus TaxID=84531 RepID=UPI0007175176|nr:hypothetical protein [Lysobacter antibioticus]